MLIEYVIEEVVAGESKKFIAEEFISIAETGAFPPAVTLRREPAASPKLISVLSLFKMKATPVV